MADRPLQPAAASAGGSHAQSSDGKRKGSTFWRVVFWVAMAVCVISVAILGFIVWSYWNASQQYQEIADSAQPQIEGKTLADMTVDWDYLRSINSEVVAWIYVPGTNINYPVCHTTDNSKYLDTDFNGVSGFGWAAKTGTIFLDTNCDPSFSDSNNILYGHHMIDGSMFCVISDMVGNDDLFNDHRTIYVLTPTMNYRLTSFSVVRSVGSDLLSQPSFSDTTEMTSYVQDKIDRSTVQPDDGMPQASNVSKLFMLSTCTNTSDDGRAILYADTSETAVPKSASTTSTDNSSSVSTDDAAAVADAAKQEEAA